MDRGSWRRPVVLEAGGRRVTVPDTFVAARLLVGAWPDKGGEMHAQAVKSCRDVLKGGAIAGLARADFIEAALQAGFHVRPETFLGENWAASADTRPMPEPQLSGVDLYPIIRRQALWEAPAAPPIEEEPRIRELFSELLAILGMIGRRLLGNAGRILTNAHRAAPHGGLR